MKYIYNQIKRLNKPLAIRNIKAIVRNSFTAQQLSIAMGNKIECKGNQRTNKQKHNKINEEIARQREIEMES